MIPIDVIFRAGCQATRSRPSDMRGPSRRRVDVTRRRFIAQKMRDEGYSYPEIGRALGGRHHTTIMSLLGVFEVVRKPPQKAPHCEGLDHVCKESAA